MKPQTSIPNVEEIERLSPSDKFIFWNEAITVRGLIYDREVISEHDIQQIFDLPKKYAYPEKCKPGLSIASDGVFTLTDSAVKMLAKDAHHYFSAISVSSEMVSVGMFLNHLTANYQFQLPILYFNSETEGLIWLHRQVPFSE